jgi:hypothetical protein
VHLDRDAMGICVSCRGRFCTECITKLDGVNHCAACVSARADAERGVEPSDDLRPARRWLSLLVGSAMAVGVTYLLLTAASPAGW